MKLPLTVVLALCLAGTAIAQLRTIPDAAKRGTIRHLQDMTVEIDGRPVRLAPGAQIRGRNNFLVLPTALPPDALVKYIASPAGELVRIWILTEEEASKSDQQAE